MSAALYDLFWPGAVMVFIYGLLFGSFFNVCIYRVPYQRSIVMPGSHCYSCGTALKLWPDNVPLLSYLLVRGNCRYCGSHFSARYFMVELLTGLLFLLVYIRFGIDWILPFHLVFTGLLIVGTFTDIDHFVLPHGVTIGGLAFALVTVCALAPLTAAADSLGLARDLYRGMNFMQPDASEPGWLATILWSGIGAGFGWGLLFTIGFVGSIVFRKESMGGGDMWLFAFLGAYLGPLNCIWILFVASLIGSNLGLTFLLCHWLMRGDKHEDIPLPPERCLFPREEAAADTTVADAAPTPTDGADASSPPPPAVPSIRVARRTTKQLHMLPFGPYIAAGALVVLLFQAEIVVFIGEPLGISFPSAARCPWAIDAWKKTRAEFERKQRDRNTMLQQPQIRKGARQ